MAIKIFVQDSSFVSTLWAFYICPYSSLKLFELATASPSSLRLDYEQI